MCRQRSMSDARWYARWPDLRSKLRSCGIFKIHLLCHFRWELEGDCCFYVQARFLISLVIFVSRDFYLGWKKRCEIPVWPAGEVDRRSCTELILHKLLVHVARRRLTWSSSGGSCMTTKHHASTTTTPAHRRQSGIGLRLEISYHWPNCRSVDCVLGSSLRQSFLAFTSVTSALEVF